MQTFKFVKTVLLLAVGAFMAASCDTNDEIIPTTPDDEFDVILEVSEGAGSPSEKVTVDANTQATITAKVSFSSTDATMRRLYITQNIAGRGEEPYMPSEVVDDKADGSIDIKSGSTKGFEFEFDLPVPSGVNNGTVVYKFWTTTGNGDFRDVTKRLAVGPGTIELMYGTGSNPVAEVETYEDIRLAAPLADGSSATFISLLDGKVYKINQGQEFVAFWDFGYYYGSVNHASLSSTSDYPSSVMDIETVANTTDELNNAFFKLSALTSDDFDGVSAATDLDFISTTTDETITGLTPGDVVEFVDEYGKKGLIRVDHVEGTYNSGDYIQIDIKVQP